MTGRLNDIMHIKGSVNSDVISTGIIHPVYPLLDSEHRIVRLASVVTCPVLVKLLPAPPIGHMSDAREEEEEQHLLYFITVHNPQK